MILVPRQVVIAGIPTHSGGQEVVVRIRNLAKSCAGNKKWCFQLRLQEPCMDDQHAEEQVSWLVVESGVFLTDDGTVMQAGTSMLRGGKFQSVMYTQPFSAEAVVLTQVMSYNDAQFVKARQTSCVDRDDEVVEATTMTCSDAVRSLLAFGDSGENAMDTQYDCTTDNSVVGQIFGSDTWDFGFRPADYCPVSCGTCSPSTGFLAALEQLGSGSDHLVGGPVHGQETVGYLAVEQDSGHAGGLGFDAFRTLPEVTHETTSLPFRYPFGTAPLFFASISSYNGHDSSALRQNGETASAFARVFIEEETCNDAEQNHFAAEEISYMAIQSTGSRMLVGVRKFPAKKSLADIHTDVNVGESGSVLVADVSITIELTGSYSNPRVFAGLLEENGGQEAVVRVANMRHDASCHNHWCFDISVAEASCYDVNHAFEHVDYVVFEEGTFFTPSASMIQVGSVDIKGGGFQTVYFNGEGFPAGVSRSIVTQVQTSNTPGYLKSRQLPGDSYGFSAALEQEGHISGSSAHEKIGWLAVQTGSGLLSSTGNVRYESRQTGYEVGHKSLLINFGYSFGSTPRVLASIASFHNQDASALRQGQNRTSPTATSFFIEETRCQNANVEVGQHEVEQVNYLAFSAAENQGCVAARDAPCNYGRFSSTAVFAGNSQRLSDIGETGSIDSNHTWNTVQLQGKYSAPVVLTGVLGRVGTQVAIVRVRDVRYGERGCVAWCFDVRVQEPSECQDDTHLVETIPWMVWESGLFYTDEGKLLQVGSLLLAGGAFGYVNFMANSFAHDDISVLSQVQTYNDPTFVKTRQQAGDASGFSIALEEAQKLDLSEGTHVHLNETVGWFALESSEGHIGFTGYSAQTTANSVTHMPFDIDFKYPFSKIPSFFANIATYQGADAAALRLHNNATVHGAQVVVEEEKCIDDEVVHNSPEGVAAFTIAAGKRAVRGTVVGGCGWEHIEYNWIDAKTLGSPVAVSIGDDDSVSVTLPFEFGFPFFGEKKTAVKISSNGYITFGAEHFPYGNTRPIPSRNTPNEAIFVYWSDWNPPGDPSSAIYTYAEHSLFVIQWDSFPTWGHEDETATFQVVLVDDGTIKFMYQDIVEHDYIPRYARASIGIENTDGSAGVRVAFDDQEFPSARSGVSIPPSCAVGERRVIGENGDVLTVNDPDPERSWVTVQLQGEYSNPVVLASVPTSLGVQEAVARVQHIRHGGGNCSGWCFDIRLQEPGECMDDRHAVENLAWMVVDAGVYYTDEGNLFQAGVLGATGGAFQSVVFHQPFFDHNTAGVAAISQIQTCNDQVFAKTRQQLATSEGFSVALEQAGSVAVHVHGEEVVGWFAVGHGTGHIGTSAFEAYTTADVVTHEHYDIDFTYPFASAPRLFGSVASFDGADPCGLRLAHDPTTNKAVVYVQEETCSDAEIDHTTESVSFIAITPGNAGRESNGMIFAGVRWQANQRDARQQPIGEEGYIMSRNAEPASTWTTVELQGQYLQPPVIIGGVPTQNSESEVVVRIKYIRKGSGGCAAGVWCFDIRLQEPACYPDQHQSEHVPWVAISRGTFYTDEGAMFQADTIDLEQRSSTEFLTVPFRGSVEQQRSFAGSDLVIMSQVLTNNQPTFVKTRHRAEPCPAAGYATPTDSFSSLWVEISGTGTAITHDQWTCGGCGHAADDGWYEINLQPGIFRWFGIEENILTVGTNGVLTFGAAQFQYGSSEPAPCAGSDGCPGGGGGLGVDGALAVLWCDLNVDTVGAVYYQVDSLRVIVEWMGVPYFGHESDSEHNTFEAILSFDGNVKLLYQTVQPGAGSWSIPSVGYEDQSGAIGQQIMYGTAADHQVPADGTAYTIPVGCHSEGFAIALESGTSDRLGEQHAAETVGWWAMIVGSGHIGAKAYEAKITPREVTHNVYPISFDSPFHTTPRFFANMATYFGTDPSTVRLDRGQHPVTVSGAAIFIEEEVCSDNEVRHVERHCLSLRFHCHPAQD